MIKTIYYIVFLCFALQVVAQVDVFNKGEGITILGGTTVYINGDYTNAKKSKGIASEGELHITGDIINHAPDSLFVTNDGTVVFCGTENQSIIGDSSIKFHRVELSNKTSEIQLRQSIIVRDTLLFSTGDVFLNGYTIDLESNGLLVNESNENRVYGLNGKVTAVRTLASNQLNIAGLGLSIESSVSLGNTQVTRYHNAQSGASAGGILRYFKLEPSILGETLDKLTVRYFDDKEVNGLDEAKFSVWKSQNNGVIWHKQNSLPVVGNDYVISTGVTIDSSEVLITLAESACTNVPQVDLGKDTVYLCTTDSVTLDAKNSGFFFLWSEGSTSQTITVKTENEYHVRVTDANGCVGYDTIQVIEKPFPVLDFKANFVCQEMNSIIENNSTIAEDTMSFSWDFGVDNVLTDTSTNSQPTYLYDTTGLYSITLSTISDFGCKASLTKEHRVHPLPVVDFSVSNVCENDTSRFVNSSTVRSDVDGANYVIASYDWEFGEVGNLDVSIAENPNYLYTSVNDYSPKLVIETNAGCVDSVQRNVSIYPRTNVSFDVDSVCLGNDINIVNNSLLSLGTVDYLWSFNDGLTSTLENPQKIYQQTGTYKIQLNTLTNNGCLDSASKQVVIYELPVAQFTVNDTCENLTLSLINSSSGATTLNYLWDWDDNSISAEESPIKKYQRFGSYDVKLVVISDNQCKDSVVKEVEVFASPLVNFSVESICKGKKATFLNSTSISDGSGLNYNWDFDLGLITSSLKSPQQEYDTSGVFDVTLSVTSLEGCRNVLTKSLEVYGLPVIDLEEKIGTCVDAYVLDVSTSGMSYVWSDGSTKGTLEVTNSGNYSVLVTDANKCQNRASTTVSLNSQFTPTLGDDKTGCDNIILNAGNVGSESYLWSTGENTRTIDVKASGEYIVTIVDQNNCEGKDTINVIINKSPVVELGEKQMFCDGITTTVDAQNVGSSFEWSTGETTQTVVLDSAGSYSVKVTDANGCFNSDNIVIEVFTLPQIKLGKDKLVCDRTTLAVDSAWTTILWSTGEVSKTINITTKGEYWLTVSDTNNCTNSDTVLIDVATTPIVNLGGDVKICSQQDILLDAGNTGLSYDWVTNEITQTIVVNSSGLYAVSVTSTEGCVGTDTLNVFVEPTVQVELGENKILCKNQQLTLDAGNSGGVYSWNSNVNISGDGQTIVVSDSGLYWVDVTTKAGCKGQDTIHVFVVNEELKPEFVAVSSLVIGDTVQFVNVSEPEQLVYNWSFDDGVTSTAEDPTHVFFTDGVFTVSLTVSNGVCSQTVTKPINVFIPRQEEDSTNTTFDLYNQIISATLFPNPVQEMVSISVDLETEGEMIMVLYTVDGKKVFVATTEEENVHKVFDMSTLPVGMYLLKISIANDSKVLRFVKI